MDWRCGAAGLALALAPAMEVAARGFFGQLPAEPVAWTDFESLSVARCAVAGGSAAELSLRRHSGLPLTAVLERTRSTPRGYSLSGFLAGAPDSAVTLVASGGLVYGTAWTPEGSYLVRGAGGPRLGEPPIAGCGGRDPRADEALDGSTAGGDVPVVDLAVFYLPSARLWAGGHRATLAMVDHGVAWVNDALVRSDVALRVELVAAVELAAHWTREEIPTVYYDIDDPNDGWWDEIPAIRESYAADVVGLAYPFDEGGHGSSWNRGPAEWAIGSASRLARALGSAMWAYESGGVFEAADGRRYCTIMCERPWDPWAPYDVRLPRFSNPRQNFRGHPLGSRSADAARKLNEAADEYAALRRSADRCGYRLVPALVQVPAAGGEFQVRVEADAGCAWTARAVDGLATMHGRTSGVGSGTISYRVPASAGWEREVALAVAGEMHIAVQASARPVKPVCERSAAMRDALSAAIGLPCGEATAAALADVPHLDLGGARRSDRRWRVDDAATPFAPAPGDFDGLANLNRLNVAVEPGHALRPGLFDGLASLVRLELHNAATSGGADQDGSFRFAVADGVLGGLPKLRHLILRGAELDADPFGGLDYLRSLDMYAIAGVRTGTFHGLGYLGELGIGGSDLSQLSAGTFDGLPLHELRLTDLTGLSLPAGVFDGLGLDDLEVSGWAGGEAAVQLNLDPSLFDDMWYLKSATFRRLQLQLRPGAFRSVSDTLWRLQLNNVGLSNLAPDTFRGLGLLSRLSLSNHRGEAGEVLAFPNDLPTLPPGIFRDLSLHTFELAEVGLEELDPAWFADLATFARGDWDPESFYVDVDLRGNQLTTLPAELLSTVPIGELDLADNRLRRLPPDLFVGLTSPYGLQLRLHGNPGAPFVLRVDVVGTGPSAFALELPRGAPRGFEFRLSAASGHFEKANGVSAVEYVRIAAGETRSPELRVVPWGAEPVVVGVELRTDLAASCWILWGKCLTGIRADVGGPLLVYADREFGQDGPPWRMALADVFPDIDVAGATFTAVSSDPAIATATVAGGALAVAAGTPGDAAITVTGVFPDGRSVTRTFAVHVPEEGRPFLRGWRWSLAEEA